MDETPLWQRDIPGVAWPIEVFGLPGIDQMRLAVQGRLSPPPLYWSMGMRPTDIGPGTSVFTMPATEHLLTPAGVAWGGPLAILADGPLGGAMQSTLPPATPYTTSDLSLSLVRPVPRTGLITARGSLVHGRRSTGITQCQIIDDRGRLIAYGTSRLAILPQVDMPTAKLEDFPVLPTDVLSGPRLCDGPPQGGVIPQEVWSTRRGLDILQSAIDGEYPTPPFCNLSGMRPTSVSDGRATAVMPAHRLFVQPMGVIEGGALACLLDFAMVGAVQTTVEAGTVYAPVDLRVQFIRPAPPDGRDLTATAEVTHRGRTFAYATARITNADGKLVALGQNTCIIRTGTWAALVGEVEAPD